MGNTTISAAAGGITVFLLRYAMIRRYDLGALCNGILAGLVSVTAGCGNVEPGSAFFIGIFGGCLYLSASTGLKRLHIDDPLDAFPVHGVCGAWVFWLLPCSIGEKASTMSMHGLGLTAC